MARTIDADELIARVMRLSRGDVRATWTALGVVKIIEEGAAQNRGKNADDFSANPCYSGNVK